MAWTQREAEEIAAQVIRSRHRWLGLANHWLDNVVHTNIFISSSVCMYLCTCIIDASSKKIFWHLHVLYVHNNICNIIVDDVISYDVMFAHAPSHGHVMNCIPAQRILYIIV